MSDSDSEDGFGSDAGSGFGDDESDFEDDPFGKADAVDDEDAESLGGYVLTLGCTCVPHTRDEAAVYRHARVCVCVSVCLLAV